MTDKHFARAVEQAASIFGCDVDDLKGLVFKDVLRDLDRIGGIVVYWGCYTDDDLERII